MKLFLARFISILFHPFIVSLPSAFIIVFETSGDIIYSFKWVILTTFFTGLVVGFVLFGIAIGFFTDIDVSVRKDRAKFYLFSIVASLLYIFSIIYFNGPKTLLVAIIVLLFGIIIMDLINFRIKASLHAASASALISAFVILYGGMFYLSLLFIPLTIWSRIILKRHTLSEGIAGSMLGAILAFFVFFVVKYFR